MVVMGVLLLMMPSLLDWELPYWCLLSLALLPSRSIDASKMVEMVVGGGGGGCCEEVIDLRTTARRYPHLLDALTAVHSTPLLAAYYIRACPRVGTRLLWVFLSHPTRGPKLLLLLLLLTVPTWPFQRYPYHSHPPQIGGMRMSTP